jgi:TrbL/VirB6 plasmid conjugal transfer protein
MTRAIISTSTQRTCLRAAAGLRSLTRRPARVVLVLLILVLALGLLAAPALAGDVYGNIGPAPQLPAGSLINRYPLGNYQLDQFFPAISVGLLSGVDVSGVAPMIAYFIAQIIWLITAFLANAVITLFAFAFNLDLVNGNGTPGSGALTPVSGAIHNLYASTFGAPWLIVAIVLAGCWAMWKALVQRRYTETAGALALSLIYCVLAIGIVTQPENTIGPASKLSNQLSSALLSLTSTGSIGSEAHAKTGASNQLFSLLILNPWTVLEFGGIEHCVTTTTNGKTRSVPVRPLSSNPAQDTQLAARLETGTEVHTEGKTCINDREKYAAHFLAYPYQSSDRDAEHEALEHGSDEDLPETDPAKHNGSYPLGKADEPAAEAMGKGGQYQRLLLAIVILAGEIGAFLLLGALALGVILAQILLLLLLAFAPVALIIAVFPGRGHDFFRAWLTKLASFLARKVLYSLILAVLLAVCQAVEDATSNLGWLLSFALQAAFLWAVFLQRHRLASDLLAATTGSRDGSDGTSRLQTLYYTTRLARMAGLNRRTPIVAPTRGRCTSDRPQPPADHGTAPRGVNVPEPGDELDEPIAGSEAPPPIPTGPAVPDPDEEPA